MKTLHKLLAVALVLGLAGSSVAAKIETKAEREARIANMSPIERAEYDKKCADRKAKRGARNANGRCKNHGRKKQS